MLAIRFTISLFVVGLWRLVDLVHEIVDHWSNAPAQPEIKKGGGLNFFVMLKAHTNR